MEKNNYTYLLRCADGSLYCGWTNDLEKRLSAHNAGTASKYTRTRLPVEMVYAERHDSKQEAMKREYRIKHLTKEDKEALILSDTNILTQKNADG
ncbi:MAG: GIY-YIG nuclease family protein [Ruminococcus sp.]|nr:GIY-YIG nuclease family protein [Ruminococcus sp.]